MRALLDVNVLIALLDSGHVHHEAAMRWLGDNIGNGWASCPITENGCLRIMSQPAYPNTLPVAEVTERLREATATDHHRFWPDDLSLLESDALARYRVVGPKQITDVYLLALAVARRGVFVTFDARIAPGAVAFGAERHHLTL